MMASIIESIMTALNGKTDARTVHEAMLNAAFLFEKSRGQSPCGWPDEVIAADLGREDIARLKRAVVAYVERTGIGSWTLGKCFDPALKPVFVSVLRRQLNGDAGELFQAMIALDNLGERVFGEVRSRSILDESQNRKLVRAYLSRYAHGDVAAG